MAYHNHSDGALVEGRRPEQRVATRVSRTGPGLDATSVSSFPSSTAVYGPSGHPTCPSSANRLSEQGRKHRMGKQTACQPIGMGTDSEQSSLPDGVPRKMKIARGDDSSRYYETASFKAG